MKGAALKNYESVRQARCSWDDNALPAYDTGRFKKPYLRVANVYDGYLDLSDVMEMDLRAGFYDFSSTSR